MLNVNSIMIVGGGSAGWMSAAFLKRTFPDMDITIIESPDHPTVGVGESTFVSFAQFRDYLGIKDEEFMPHCDASYKMSIKFNDFYDVDSGGFHYPFRTPHVQDTNYGLADWLEMKAFDPDLDVNDFARSYFPSAALYENNKFTDNHDGRLGNWNKQTDVSYHFDATKFGLWLRDHYCLPRGVKLLTTSVEDINTDENGVSSLKLSNGDTVTSDLYIDCTGFKSLILGQTLEEPFTPYSDILPNDYAWATKMIYIDKEKELQPYTNCTALKNGWVWNIPTWNRIGTGYVYSSKYVSHDDALEEFKQHLMSDKMMYPRTQEEIDEMEFVKIPMRIGLHKRTWVKNVVALGLSAGFIEPLEGNGLMSVQVFLQYLAKSLLRGKVTQLDVDTYNSVTSSLFKDLAEFIAMHYALSIRDDSQYWKDISTRIYSPELHQGDAYPFSNAAPASFGATFLDFEFRKMLGRLTPPENGITYISVGMNHPVFNKVDQLHNTNNRDLTPYINELKFRFNQKKIQWQEAAKNCPSLYTYLKDNVYEGRM
jgi:flavin-dependent dehydrogenase